jgi:hypothetical protein
MPSKGRNVPARTFLGDDADISNALMHGLVIKWMQLQKVGGESIAVFEADLRSRPDVRRLLAESKRNGGWQRDARSKWSFITALVGLDKGKTFISLHYEIYPPNACTFDLVFVEGDHDEQLNMLRATGGRFLLGYNGDGMKLRAPIEDLTDGLRNYKIKQGIAGPTTPSA